MPKSSTLPVVKVTYKQQPLTKKCFNENPAIQALYPTGDLFMQEYYIPALQEAKQRGIQRIIEVTENGVTVI